MLTPTFVKRSETFVSGSRTLAGHYYTSPAIFAEEQARIFYRRWLCVGRADQVAQPGAYFLQQVGDESLIILRDRRGVLRAFYNVCRHRGTRLCETASGQFAETIQCPYHAWTYTLAGQLVGAPHMNEVDGFDRGDYPLHPVMIESWDGFLLINLERAGEPFAAAFAPLIGRFDRFQVGRLRAARRITYDVRANWKLIIQNYSECLHCPTLHPGLAKISPYMSGQNDLFEGPYLGGYMDIVEDADSLTLSGRACALPVSDNLPAGDAHRVYYYSIYPNLLLSLHPDYVMFHTLWPQAPDRTHIVCEWLFRPESFEQPDFNSDDAVLFWDQTNRQDWHICEQSQSGIASRRYQPGPYSMREALPAAWDREYLKTLESEGAQ